MGKCGYSYVGAVVGATYPEMGCGIKKTDAKSFILVPGYGAQGAKGSDLTNYFNEDGLGAIVNSSRGIMLLISSQTMKNSELQALQMRQGQR